MPEPSVKAKKSSTSSFSDISPPMPEMNAIRMPGTKWWMWRPLTLTFRNGPWPSRIAQVTSRTEAKVSRKPLRM